MLKTFESIKGVGLFHDTGSSPPLSRLTLIYGENGRGKSTLACILRSCATNDGALLVAKRTLGESTQPHVELTISHPVGADLLLQWDGSTWSGFMPNLQVFDAEFVSENVYAGAEINTDQRAHLLEFALGDKAVAFRKKVDEAGSRLIEATAEINAQTAVVRAHARTMSLDSFVALPVAPNGESEITQLEKRIAAAKDRDQLLARNAPVHVSIPDFDLDTLFGILRKSLPDIEETAEKTIKNHLEKCGQQNFEQWLAQGGKYTVEDACPYCGTSITGNDLIKAYRAHFNAAYGKLKAEVADIEQVVINKLDDAVVTRIQTMIEAAQARTDAWKPYLDIQPIGFDSDGLRSVLAQLRGMLEPLISTKSGRPLEAAGSLSDQTKAADLWATAIGMVADTNVKIQKASSAIAAFKASLPAENVASLREAVETLRMRIHRHSSSVDADIKKLNEAVARKKARSDEKDAARKDLDELMTATLSQYQAEINTLLEGFHTQIRIESLGFDYRGASGVPRSDYQLKVRGHGIKLSGEAAANFGNTLSEGDKRALAFAFFIARLHEDPNLADQIVVIDDPMCSLDRRRRTATVRLLRALASQCKQLVVLAHDPHFLQDFDDKVRRISLFKKQPALICHFKIVPAPNDYSDFGPLSLHDECASQYEKDLAQISDYVDAKPGIDASQVARSLRVVLETSLHRQFPSIVPRGEMFGQVIERIDQAIAPSRLAALKPSVSKLRALNDYLAGFHHAEGEPSPAVTSIDEGELRGCAKNVLDFVFRG